MAFIVQSEIGLKVVNYSELLSYGYQVFVHSLCHVSLRFKQLPIIDLTCHHPAIDRCSAVVSSVFLYSQHHCTTYKENRPIAKTTNALVTASTNLLK
jgi:hypothetical protein